MANKQTVLILIGKSRNGKTTLLNVLQDPEHVPKSLSLFSSTKSIEEKNMNGMIIIDTPGLCDINHTSSKEKRLTDNEILKQVSNKFQEYSDPKKYKIVVLYIFSINGGILTQDKESLKKYHEILYKKQDNIKYSFVLSHCENFDEEQRNELKQQLSNDRVIKEYINKHEYKVHFSGAMNEDYYTLKNNEDALSFYLEMVNECRADLLNFMQN